MNAPDRFAIAAELRHLGELLALSGAQPFRAQAYAKGATALEAAEDFDRLLAQRRLTTLPGIGQGLAAVITEIAETGRATLRAELEAQLPRGAVELSPILGVEPLRKLQAALGIADIDALEAACVAGEVRKVHGFGDKTEARLLDKIRAHRARGTEILLAEARAIAAEVKDWLESEVPDLEVVVVGDVRRGLELVDRIDLAAIGDGAAVEAFTRFPKLARAALGEAYVEPVSPSAPTVSGALSNGIRVSLWHLPIPDGLALVRLTGPDEHAAAIAARVAASTPGAGPGRFEGEDDVYVAAGFAPVAPERRDDPDALGPRPERLLAATDLQGVVHCHTTWSDGRHSVADMARAAAARGFGYITFTDHSQTASYANGLDPDRLLRQWDEIDRVQAETPVRLLKGIESDILADGSLDLPDAILARLDVVIASIHARNGQGPVDMTRRLIAMCQHPVKKIWGHPLGRMLQRRAPIDCDLERVLEAAARSGTIIELNGDPHRMDMPVDLARRARRLGLKFVASVDAHATNELAYLDNAVTLARRAGLGPDDVLNTLDAAAFLAAVRPVGPASS